MALLPREQLRRDLRDVLALETRDGQLVRAGQPFAFGAGDRRRAVRRAAGDLVQVQQLLCRIGNAGNDHALVVEKRVQADDGRLLSAVLAGGGRERAADLADQRAAAPEWAGVVEEPLHLRRGAAVARAGAEDDRV